MSTSAVTSQPTTVIEFETRRGVELIKFKEGDIIEGQVISAKRKKIEEKENVLCFLVELREGASFEVRTGRLVEFPQHADMTTKLLPTDVGKLIRVRCTGEQKMSGDRNPMKKFDVQVSKGKYDLPNDITDEDIPF